MVSPRGGYPVKRPAQESLGGNTLEYNWPLILLPLQFSYTTSAPRSFGREGAREREGEAARGEESRRREGKGKEKEKERRRAGGEGFIYLSKLD